jgi:hypothetical protein
MGLVDDPGSQGPDRVTGPDRMQRLEQLGDVFPEHDVGLACRVAGQQDLDRAIGAGRAPWSRSASAATVGGCSSAQSPSTSVTAS